MQTKSKMLRRLVTSNRQRAVRPPDIYCREFQKYLGRTLSATERVVISALERQRHRGRPRPVMVIDHDKNDSTRILNDYLRYRLATSPDDATALSITPRSAGIRIKTPRVKHITYRQADSLRGSTPSFILMTDAQDACSFSPFRKRPAGFLRLCRALFPILYGVGFIVIHMRADAPPSHAPAIGECDSTPPPKPEASPPVTVITLTSIDDVLFTNQIEPKTTTAPHPRPL